MIHWFKNLFVKQKKVSRETISVPQTDVYQITPHFHYDEFRCKDKARTPYPSEWIESRLRPLCNQLEVLRDYFKKPIRITSAYRTSSHNKFVGGSPRSKHLDGIAVDFRVDGVDPRQVAIVVRSLIGQGKITQGGVGDYSTFTHYDIRGTLARWSGR